MSSKSATQFRLEQKFQKRLYFAVGVILFCVFIMSMQLGNLQLVRGYENRVLAKKFVSRQEFTIAPRGLVYDRHGPVGPALIQNINYIDFVIHPARFRNRDEGERFLREFSALMGRPFEEFADKVVQENWQRMVRRNEPIVLLNRMSKVEQERLAEFRMSSRYGEFVDNHVRYYSMGPALAHVSGYIGLPSRHELDRKLALPYQMIGKGGLEARYDSELRGTDGVRVRSRVLESEEQIAASEHGNNIILSIDRDIQAAAYRSLVATGKRGTAIAMRASTGEILALVSNPSFDPNLLSSASSDKRNAHYKDVDDHEGFLNIAIQAKFPPASTFKPLVALAALEAPEPLRTPETTTFYCPGKWVLPSSMPGVTASEHFDTEPHGTNDMVGAIQKSCNVYFYQLGHKIGATPMIQLARNFGLDRRTGIDLPGEINGFVPDQRWKQITWSSRWYDGDTVNMAIGQGFLEVTPLEVAVYIAALANRGKIYRPHLVNEVRDPLTDKVLRKVGAELIKEVPISQKSLEIVHKGMRQVVLEGTAAFLNRKDLPPIAGKTGTVQTRSQRKSASHAWFMGFAPFGAPPEEQIVVVVFVEFGVWGASTAAPVAGDIFKAAFSVPALQPANTNPVPGTPGQGQPQNQNQNPNQAQGNGQKIPN
ncbi:MAG: penicillin-binding protein 2 [Spirochaetia bacterium]|nr:penicillin-binding protein 2 [Spirochaetia bacterium]